MAYLGYFKKRAKFSLATSAYTNGAKPYFPIFPMVKIVFVKGYALMPPPPPPPQYATELNTALHDSIVMDPSEMYTSLHYIA